MHPACHDPDSRFLGRNNEAREEGAHKAKHAWLRQRLELFCSGSWLRENAKAQKALRILLPSHGSLKRGELRKFLDLFALSGSSRGLWSGLLPWKAIESGSRKKILTNFRPHTFLRSQGRVEMWRGGVRLDLSVAAPFVWRCLSSSAVTPFPHPAHRTGQAAFPHPALGQALTLTPTAGRT